MAKTTDPYERALFDNSVERVINTALKVLQYCEPQNFLSSSLREEAEIAIEDLIYLKPYIVRCWDEARNQAFIRAQEKKPNDP